MLRHKGSQKTKHCHSKGFVCREIAGEVLEEECHDIPYSVTTLIKGNGRGTLSRHFTTLSQHEELKAEISIAKMIEKFFNHNVAILLALLQQ